MKKKPFQTKEDLNEKITTTEPQQSVTGTIYQEPIVPIQTTSANPSTTVNNTPTDSLIGLTGSQIKIEKPKITLGIYLIATLLIIGFIASFINSSNPTYIVVINFTNILLAIGLLLRNNIIRKITIGLGVFLILTLIFETVTLIEIQHLARISTSKAEISLTNLQSNSYITPAQQTEIVNAKYTLKNDQKTLSKRYVFAYINVAAELLIYVSMIIYLTRTKVKEIFENQQK